MFCEMVLGDYFLVFPLYVSHAQAMNPKVCINFTQKNTLVDRGNMKYKQFLLYFDYILEPII